MDIELAHTFLEVVETGNFIGASKRLNVSQSTVSMRVKALEHQLGRAVFIRNKSGVTLTAAGTQFRRIAATLVRVWQQARQDVALPPEFRTMLNVGGQFSLWDHLLLRWVGWMHARAPDVALRGEVGQSDWLMRQLAEEVLDIGVMYAPQSRPGLDVEKLIDETLILAATEPDHGGVRERNYIFVDWGEEFQASHGVAFPDAQTPGLSVGLGAIGLQYILEYGGAGYFLKRLVRPLLDNGRHHRVADAPEFSRPAFVVSRASEAGGVLRTALEGLRFVAEQEANAPA